MSIKVSPLSCLRLQLLPPTRNIKTSDRPQLSCVFCSLNQHLGTQWSSAVGQGSREGEEGVGERFVGKPQKNSTIVELRLRLRILHLPQTFFFCDFNLKFAQRSPGMCRNAVEEERRREKEREGRQQQKVE